MKDETLIKYGMVIFAVSLTAISFVLFAFGEIRGAYHFRLAEEYVDLIKWILGGAAGFGAINGITSAIVAVRSTEPKPEA